MKILLLGSGGRECTIAWKLTQSPLCEKLFIAPGNAGTNHYGENVDISPLDFDKVKECCLTNNIDILFVGNEDPLVHGIYDYFKSDDNIKHIVVVGPSQGGAILEGSKAFSKAFMQRYDIPTAKYAEFNKDNYEQGIEYIKNHPLPIVLKADGLAAGKGVIIAENIDTALESFKEMIQDAVFGDAGAKVVIEEFLDGIELSVFAFTDGANYVLLPEAKDYKRILEGDKGPNTGGMGAVSPLPFATEEFMGKVINKIVEPTIKGLAEEGRIYQGFIFFGLINVNGEPMVIEYNCRLGDPETEVVLPRLKNDLVELILAMNEKRLDSVKVEIDPRAAVTVMLVSEGYPGNYEKGKVINGLETVKNSMVLHAGTKIAEDGNIVTNGGRVIAITSFGENIKEALAQSYQNTEVIDFDGKTFRTDIGYEFIK